MKVFDEIQPINHLIGLEYTPAEPTINWFLDFVLSIICVETREEFIVHLFFFSCYAWYKNDLLINHIPGRKLPAGSDRKAPQKSLKCGSSIPTGNLSNFFRWFPTGSYRKAQEIDWNPPEKIQQISGRNTASTSDYFRCFPAGSSDFSASFLQDPVAVIFDMGYYL